MSNWSKDAIFYHIYPLGCCGAPDVNDYTATPVSRLNDLLPWSTYLQDLGVNALYLGPLFESATHGYDTKDFFQVDRRLGTHEDLRAFVETCHQHGIRVIFDAVFNHVGRDHFAFSDLQRNGWNSQYREWFNTDFTRQSCYGDQFWYEGWSNYFNLVKLNHKNPLVKEHLFAAIQFWIDTYGIDGIRIDAADAIDKDFFNELRTYCKQARSDFWLMGEVIHGNYRDWANPDRLDSTTNYECYKGLWSSHNSYNYFEIAYSINRQFGSNGMYREITLYNFADNHDVDRVASTLTDPAHLFPLYMLLFTIPGIPSLYYGSEWGLLGKKSNGSDAALRPAVDLENSRRSMPNKELFTMLQKLITLRKELSALRHGSYLQLLVASRQYCFLRQTNTQSVVIAVNSDKATVALTIPITLPNGTILTDQLNNQETFVVTNGQITATLHPRWGRILTA